MVGGDGEAGQPAQGREACFLLPPPGDARRGRLTENEGVEGLNISTDQTKNQICGLVPRFPEDVILCRKAAVTD